MDFEKNPLMNDTSRCRREVKRWLALVALTLAALLTGMVSAVTAPSPEAQEIANFLMIASVTAIICSLFGIRQCNDHCRSVQYGLSVFEAMKKDLEGTQSELTSARYDVTDAQSDLYFAKKNAKALQDELDATKLELQQVQERLYETEDELEKTRGWLDETENELYKSWDDLDSVKSELREAKLELRRTGEDAKFNELCYESLRKTYSETTLDLLKTRRERDGLQSKLVAVRRFARRLLAERNKLQHELTEAKIGFEWFLSLYYEAEERIRFAKQQIERLEQQIEHLETVNKLLAKFATDDV